MVISMNTTCRNYFREDIYNEAPHILSLCT